MSKIADVVQLWKLNIACTCKLKTGDLKTNRVRVGTESENEKKDLSGNVARSVISGCSMLRRTIARLQDGRSWETFNVSENARKFFLIDNLDQDTARNVLLPTLVKTIDGLSTNITINVAEKVTNFDDAGVVARETTGLIHLRSQHFSKNYRAEIREYNEDAYKYLKMQATSTLIHEATHLFAGTIDYCYFDLEGNPKEADMKNYGYKFDSRANALINADSYAWFVTSVGRKAG